MSDLRSITDVPVLLRREIETRMVKPFLDAFEQELGHEKTYEIVGRVVADIARRQGAEYAQLLGGNDLDAIVRQMEPWGAGGTLELAFRRPAESDMEMDVTRCAYVDMYRRLGMEELGRILSCSRDEPFYEGLNPEIRMTRTKTIMGGCDCCDFRFHLEKSQTKEG